MPKKDFNITLGNVVKIARNERGLTQKEVAERANIDVRTLLNIENYRGNPTLQVIFPIIRVLKIDPREIFYPDNTEMGPALCQMKSLLSECSEKEADILIAICEPLLNALRKNNSESK
ncbi:MAG: helix-turn-helix domain-containing protein [Clostridiales bacterium]|nr:helix-turn-helix domain-containing protein [Clostridiales bacterium]